MGSFIGRHCCCERARSYAQQSFAFRRECQIEQPAYILLTITSGPMWSVGAAAYKGSKLFVASCDEICRRSLYPAASFRARLEKTFWYHLHSSVQCVMYSSVYLARHLYRVFLGLAGTWAPSARFC